MRTGILCLLYRKARRSRHLSRLALTLAFCLACNHAHAEKLPETPSRTESQDIRMKQSFGTNNAALVKSMTVSQLQNLAASKLNNRDLIEKYLGTLPEWVQRIEVSGTFSLDDWRGFEVLTVQPIWQADDGRKIVFTQLSLTSYRMFDKIRLAGNAGVGYRQLFNSDSLLLGGNIFADHEFMQGHNRTGVGFEAKYGPLDFTVNGYIGHSARTIDNGIVERVPSGFDAEMATQIPYLSWAKFYSKFYRWDHKIDNHQVQGTELTFAANVHSALTIESGMRKDWRGKSEGFVMARVKLSASNTENLFDSPIIDNKAFVRRDLRRVMLDKVRRENRIILERSSPMQTQNGLTVTVSRSD